MIREEEGLILGVEDPWPLAATDDRQVCLYVTREKGKTNSEIYCPYSLAVAACLEWAVRMPARVIVPGCGAFDGEGVVDLTISEAV